MLLPNPEGQRSSALGRLVPTQPPGALPGSDSQPFPVFGLQKQALMFTYAVTAGERHRGSALLGPGAPVLTYFVLTRVVRYLQGIHFQPLVALSNAVHPGDVGACIRHFFHQLQAEKGDLSVSELSCLLCPA